MQSAVSSYRSKHGDIKPPKKKKKDVVEGVEVHSIDQKPAMQKSPSPEEKRQVNTESKVNDLTKEPRFVSWN